MARRLTNRELRHPTADAASLFLEQQYALAAMDSETKQRELEWCEALVGDALEEGYRKLAADPDDARSWSAWREFIDHESSSEPW